MDLTPIRVRGRRKRDRPADLNASSSLFRLRKVARFNHADLQVSKKPLPKVPALSAFEQLPTEIVHLIFEYSNNISLAISSPIFAQQLSAESIYVRFTADVLYAEGCTAPCTEATAVSRMLQCRWMSWKIFKTAVLQCHARAKKANALGVAEGADTDDETSSSPPPLPTFDEPSAQEKLPYLHLHTPIQLPEKLLRRPWSSEKTAFLYYLIWNGVGIDWDRSFRGEVATQGLQDAIQERNHKAVASLVSLVAGVVPSAAVIKSAIMDYGCDQIIVFHLIQAVLRAQITGRAQGEVMTDFKFRDPSLWSWAARARGNGNPKGEWILDVLRYSDDAVLGNSVYDEATNDDLVRVCCGGIDGVEPVKVPLRPSTEAQRDVQGGDNA